MSNGRWGVALFCAAGIATPAVAQDACADAAKLIGQPPTLGEWVEVKFEKPGEKPVPPMRGAFVASEQRGGRKAYWLQMTMKSPETGKPVVMQLLTPWDPAAFGKRPEMLEFVMKMGDQPAMRMTQQLQAQGNGAPPDIREYCKQSKFVGTESVTVPAGTFDARHYQSPEGDFWVAQEIPVWHLVKMTTKDGMTLTAVAKGTGAKNEITEKPMDMGELMRNPDAMKAKPQSN